MTVPGLGGQQPPPQNAAPAGQLAPGIQPGTTTVFAQLRAGDTIVNSKGVFTYSAAPAAGTLIALQAPAAGTDQFGNAYLQGVVSYLPGATYAALQVNGGAVVWWTAPGSAGPWTFSGTQLGINVATPTQFVLDATTTSGLLVIPQPSAGITTVAQVVAALVTAGVFS